MAEGPDGKNIIIIKKVSGHGGHHGGAWKVAFADFVTAMMALFMVLWLVNSASVVTRERIANFFRQPGVFDAGSGTPLQVGGAGILNDAFSPPQEGNSDVATGFTNKVYVIEKHGGLGKGVSDNVGKGNAQTGLESSISNVFDKIDRGGYSNASSQEYQEKIELEKVAEKIKHEVGQGTDFGLDATLTSKTSTSQNAQQQATKSAEVAQFLGNVEIKVDQRGLHLEIMDTSTTSMFEVGSSKINKKAEEEVTKIAKILSGLPNPIDIEGHTDASPFSGSMSEHYDNWNLSTDRANEARRLLMKAGVQEKQIARIVGYADKRLKFADKPLDPSNRRISISMRYTEQAEKSLEGTKTVVTEPKAVPLLNNQQGKQDVSVNKGLKVNLETTLPEGAVVVNPKEQVKADVWREKDKIFGNQNPFIHK